MSSPGPYFTGILDSHTVYDATGSTDTVVIENNANTVIPAGDGATTQGVSTWAGAQLIAYGATVTAAAQALTTIGLSGNNMIDPSNKQLDGVNATPAMTSIVRSKFTRALYGKGPNLVNYANEAAGKTATFKMDYLASIGSSAWGDWFPPVTAKGESTIGEYSFAGSASTAGTYNSTSFNPTPTPPIGTYIILGVRVYALSTAAFLRFQHTDFAGAYPGIPVVDWSTGTLTGANVGGNPLTSDAWQGAQFVQLGRMLNLPVCPAFRIQGQGTGLTLQLLSTNADTPQYDLIMQKVT